MPPKRLDPIKLMLAQAVQHHMVSRPNNPPLLPAPDNVVSVEATALSPLETSVRVKTTNEGTLYFIIKLTDFDNAFKYVITVPWSRVHILTGGLDYPRNGAPNGSSYAVTVDATDGMRNIYLTEISFKTILNNKLLPADYRKLGDNE